MDKGTDLEDPDGRADDGVADDEDARAGGQALGEVYFVCVCMYVWWLVGGLFVFFGGVCVFLCTCWVVVGG